MKNKTLIARIIAIALFFAFAGTNQNARGENKSVAKDIDVSNRQEKQFGAYLGILGDPHPTLLGVNIAYNATDYLRATAGFGQITVSSMTLDDSGFGTEESTLTTVGVGAKFMVPGWNFTPTAGLGYSHVFTSGAFDSFEDYLANNITSNLGFDWQTGVGFNMGMGMNLSLNDAAPTAPYINLGWFF